jgi:hypothetical protein
MLITSPRGRRGRITITVGSGTWMRCCDGRTGGGWENGDGGGTIGRGGGYGCCMPAGGCGCVPAGGCGCVPGGCGRAPGSVYGAAGPAWCGLRALSWLVCGAPGLGGPPGPALGPLGCHGLVMPAFRAATVTHLDEGLTCDAWSQARWRVLAACWPRSRRAGVSGRLARTPPARAGRGGPVTCALTVAPCALAPGRISGMLGAA